MSASGKALVLLRAECLGDISLTEIAVSHSRNFDQTRNLLEDPPGLRLELRLVLVPHDDADAVPEPGPVARVRRLVVRHAVDLVLRHVLEVERDPERLRGVGQLQDFRVDFGCQDLRGAVDGDAADPVALAGGCPLVLRRRIAVSDTVCVGGGKSLQVCH